MAHQDGNFSQSISQGNFLPCSRYNIGRDTFRFPQNGNCTDFYAGGGTGIADYVEIHVVLDKMLESTQNLCYYKLK